MHYMLSTTIAFLSLRFLVVAQSCNIETCTRTCILFDGPYGSCNFDYTNKGFDTFAACVCTFSGLDSTVADLDQCVICDKDGLGNNPLSLYQAWDAICETYKYSGKQAGENIANAQTTSVIQAFSQTILPKLQSSYCGGGGRGGGGGGGMSTSPIVNGSVPMTSPAMPTPTSSASAGSGSSPSNAAPRSQVTLGPLLGSLVLGLLLP